MKKYLLSFVGLFLLAGCATVSEQAAVKDSGKSGAASSVKVLYDFEDEADLKDFFFKNSKGTLNNDPHFVSSGKKSLQLDVNGDLDYPGMYAGLHDDRNVPFKNDWSGDYTAVKIDIYNTLLDPTIVSIRIDDMTSQNYKTRYNNDEIIIKPGWSTIRIPYDYLRYGEGKNNIKKKLDISKLRLFCLHSGAKRDMTLYVDNIRLEKEKKEE